MAKLEIRFSDGVVETQELSQERSFLIGRSEDCDLKLAGDAIQPRHATIRWVDHRYRLDVDPNARNVFTGVNPVTQLRLKPDAQFSIGDTEFRIRYGADEVGGAPLTGATPDKAVPLYLSRAFLGIVSALVVLAALSVGLFFLVRARAADRVFETARKDLTDALYDKAIEGYDAFLASFPADPRANQARFDRAKANVLQFTEGSASWSAALEAAEKMVADEAGNDEYAKHPTEIADLIINIAHHLAEQARDRSDAAPLALSETGLALLNKAVPEGSRNPDAVARVRTLQEEAKRAVARSEFIAESLASMDKSLADDRPVDVYRGHVDMIHRYAELAKDKRVLERLKLASEKDLKLVRFDAALVGKEPASDWTPSVAWTRYTRRMVGANASGEIVPIVVGDALYALDAGTGEVRWRLPTIDGSALPPATLPSVNNLLLAYRPQANEILLIDRTAGVTKQRLSLGLIRPRRATSWTFAGDRVVFAATRADDAGAGLVAVLTLAGDRLVSEGAYVFPQPIQASPVFDPQRGTLFVVGEQASIYVLDLARQSVQQVLSVGHEPGSIATAPAVAGRFLFFAVNTTADGSTLRGYVLAENSPGAEVLTQPLRGRVHESPVLKGGRGFVATDLGDVLAFDLGAETDAEPVKLAAQYTDPDQTPGMPTSIRVMSESELWLAGKTARRLQLKVGSKELTSLASVVLAGSGGVLSSTRLAGDDIVVVSPNLSGGVAIERITAGKPAPLWQSMVGTPPLGESVIETDGDAKLLVVFGDRQHLLSAGDLDNDLVAPVESSPGATILEPLTTNEAASETIPWTSGLVQGAGKSLRFVPAPTGEAESPAKTTTLAGEWGGSAARCGDGLLVPLASGYVLWIKPEDGRELSDPFAAPFESGQPMPIRAVVSVDPTRPEAGAYAAGGQSLFRIELASEGGNVWRSTARTDLGEGVIRELALGKATLWCFREKDVVAVDIATLKPIVTIAITPLMGSARAAEDRLLYVSADNEWVCLQRSEAADQAVAWKHPLDGHPAGRPLVDGGGVWLLLDSGVATQRNLGNGEVLKTLLWGRPVARGPYRLGRYLAAIALDGSVIRAALSD